MVVGSVGDERSCVQQGAPVAFPFVGTGGLGLVGWAPRQR